MKNALKFNNSNQKYVILYLVIILFVFIYLINKNVKHDINKDNKSVKEWLYVDKQFLTNIDTLNNIYINKKSYLINIPVLIGNIKGLNDNTYGTFYKRFIITQNEKKIDKIYGVWHVIDKNNLYIQIPVICSAYKIYINGKFIDSIGKIGKNKESHIPLFYPKVYKIPNCDTLDIIINFSNFSINRAGIWNQMYYGESINFLIFLKTFDYVVVSLMIFLVLLSILIYLNSYNKLYLYYSLLCLCFIVRHISTGLYILTDVLDLTNIQTDFYFQLITKIQYISLISTGIVLILFINYLYIYNLSKINKIVIKTFIIITICLILYIIIAPTNFFVTLIYVFEMYLLINVFYLIYILFKNLIKIKKTYYLLFSIILLFICGTLDALYYSGVLFIIPNLTSIGILFLLLSFICFITFKSVDDYNYIEKLNNELKEIKLENESYIIKLKELVDYIKMLSNTIIHDIKSPLRNIKQYLQKIKPNDSEYISKINTILNKTFLFIEDLSLYLKLDYNKVLTNTNINLKDLLIDSISIIEYDNKLININIKEEFIIIGDYVLLKILFTNLILNGLKHNNKNNKEIKIYIENNNDIIIEDNGVGISKENQEKIFELFYRDNINVEGSGIGLSLVKKIIDIHNFKLSVESELNIYTKFIIKI